MKAQGPSTSSVNTRTAQSQTSGSINPLLLDEYPGLFPPAPRSTVLVATRESCCSFSSALPLVNPIVHGDGVGYYAYIRAPLIQHNLGFEEDWRHANLNFSQSRTLPNGELLPSVLRRDSHAS